jgi:phosphopantetheine adenylyltransferase
MWRIVNLEMGWHIENTDLDSAVNTAREKAGLNPVKISNITELKSVLSELNEIKDQESTIVQKGIERDIKFVTKIIGILER